MDTFFVCLAVVLILPFIAGCVAAWAEIAEALTNEPEVGDE